MSKKVWIPSKDHCWEAARLVIDSVALPSDTSKSTAKSTTATSSGSNVGGNAPEVVVLTADGERKTFSREEIHRGDPSHFEDNADLCAMNHLHEAPLLDCLRRRFHADSIYTTTGDVLISINPYKRIHGLYDSIVNYLDIPEDGEIYKGATKPHVFKIANYALMDMLFEKKTAATSNTTADDGATTANSESNKESTSSSSRNQSLVVSGESGAGKTEASKYVMSFLLEADQEMNQEAVAAEVQLAQKKVADAIRQVLLHSNVIFEAFGNAKTLRNDNSSRFGKYIKLQYSQQNRIISAYTETFLLEKSRLCNVGDGERNYHVFYQLLRGSTDTALKQRLRLGAPESFRMLVDAEGVAGNSGEDQHYALLESCLRTVGCSAEELEQLWSIVAAVLHMGNMHTASSGDDDGVGGGSSEGGGGLGSGKVSIVSPSMPLQELTSLLGVSEEMFETRLITQRVQVKKQ